MSNIPRLKTELGNTLLQLIAKSNTKWTLRDGGNQNCSRIRDENFRCPVCSVIHQQNPLIDYEDNAWQASIEFLGRKLTSDEMRDLDKITVAADYDYTVVLCDDEKGIRDWFFKTLTFDE